MLRFYRMMNQTLIRRTDCLNVGSFRAAFVIFVARVASAGLHYNHNLRAGARTGEGRLTLHFRQSFCCLTSLQLMHNGVNRSSAHSVPGLIWRYCLTSVPSCLEWARCIVRTIVPLPDQHGARQNQTPTASRWSNDHCNCRTLDLNTFVLFHKDFILILHLMEGKKTPEVHWQFRQMEELKVEKWNLPGSCL